MAGYKIAIDLDLAREVLIEANPGPKVNNIVPHVVQQNANLYQLYLLVLQIN